MKHLPRMQSGIPGLDQILNGGFIDGASYIVQGRPGAGKTILANQIAFARASAGARVLYVTLLAESHERLFQSMSTLDFFDDQKLGREIIFVSVFHTLREEGLDAVVQLLRQETKRHRATLLIFDGLLNARDRAATDLDVKTFVAEVQGQAAFVGCTVLFLTSARLEDNSPEYTMVDGVIDLSDELFGVRSVRQMHVRKSRGSKAISGLHQYEISDAGITVYPRIEAMTWPAAATMPTQARATSGVASIDALLNGGLPQGSISLLAGPSGSGKTSLGLHFLSAGSVDEPALHFGFYEEPESLLAKARALGIDLSKSGSPALEICWNQLGENLLDKLGHQLLDLVRQNKTRRVFIDGFGAFDRAAVHKDRLVEFASVLTNQLRRLGVTVLMTWELRDFGDLTERFPSVELSAMFDNLIMIRQSEQDHDLLRSIAVQKMRNSTFDSAAHALQLGIDGLKIGAKLSPSSKA
ncbi:MULTISPECIES: ATPase domain-containing protein [unclassified Achromobacter]|uniref:ATPase domain-containing protein n=1 Tax=unclassified Achromobacter TaxID=2626865 RepID=UPI000B51B337|nr:MULTISPECIES: ATPase domain-containing protein [unclassified Achromobacter]OWT77020.1 serine/threonine protein kinase [Achromobacter sp. HZ28]OWT77901.1 serine/threonine protein kinase [Achromobacter sp. HZ34]